LRNLFFAQPEIQPAQRNVENVLQLAPDHYGALGIAAQLAMLDDAHQLAIEYYLARLQQQSDIVDDNNNLAACYLRQQEYSLAVEYFTEALVLDPDRQDVRANLANTFLQADRPLQSITHYLDYLQTCSDDIEARYNLGVAYLAVSDSASARQQWQQVLQQHPTHFDTLVNMAALDWQTARHKQAIEYLHAAQRLQPADEAVNFMLAVANKTPLDTMPTQYTQRLFDFYAQHYDQHMKDVLAYQLPAFFQQWVETQTSCQQWRVADLGCGSGMVMAQCGQRFAQLVGVDVSQKMLAQAAKTSCYDALHPQTVQTFLQDNRQSFDLLVVLEVMAYIGACDDLFAQLAANITADGRVLLSVECLPAEITNCHYQCSQHGRFQYGHTYLQQQFMAAGLVIDAQHELTLRQHKGQDVAGCVYVLSKMAAH